MEGAEVVFKSVPWLGLRSKVVDFLKTPIQIASLARRHIHHGSRTAQLMQIKSSPLANGLLRRGQRRPNDDRLVNTCFTHKNLT